MDNGMKASLDSYITGGRYRRTIVDCECKECGYNFQWTVCYEYGMSWYEPEEVYCPKCKAEYKEQQDDKITGISKGNISAVCLGLRRTIGGYIWRYESDLFCLPKIT